MVAHDLREPVTEHRPPRDAARAPAGRGAARPGRSSTSCSASTERARELIDGVLAYARAGELRPRARSRWPPLMAEVAEDLRAAAARQRRRRSTSERCPEVDGDPRRLRRLLQNLVGQRREVPRRRPLRIEVSARRRRGRMGRHGARQRRRRRSRPMRGGSSGCSPAPAATRRGPASAWPSAGASSRPTAATSGSSPRRAAAARFASRCHAERRERTAAVGRGPQAGRAVRRAAPSGSGHAGQLPGGGRASSGRCATTTGRIVDFRFGYGNPGHPAGVLAPGLLADKYTLLQALPQLGGSRAFEA